MRHLILAIICFSSLTSLGQNCGGYYYFNTDSTAELKANLPPNKDMITTLNFTGVKSENDGCSSQCTYDLQTKKNRKPLYFTAHYFYVKDTLKIPIANLIPLSNTVGNDPRPAKNNREAFVCYPTNLVIGETLPDVKGDVKGTNSDNYHQEMTVEIKDRIVEKQEKVTLSGRTFNCFKITFSYNVVSNGTGHFDSFKLLFAEWFSPGFGVVKTEIYFNKNRMLQSFEISLVKKRE